MRKALLLTCALFGLSITASAQMNINGEVKYGNEWIDFGKPHFKVMVAKDGIYRIPIPEELASVPASHLRMYYFGAEIPIYITNDSIEFYGVKNRGEMDRFLYADPADQFNPRYSLFTDSSAYFLTWRDSVSEQQFEETSNDLSNPPPKEEYYIENSILIFTNAYKKNFEYRFDQGEEIPFSHFLDGEGWGSTGSSFTIPVSFVYENGPDAQLTFRFASITHNANNISATFADTAIQYTFTRFQGVTGQFDIPIQKVNAPSFSISFSGNNKFVSSLELKYPRTFNASGKNLFVFTIDSSSEKKYLEVENFDHGGIPPVLYDLTNQVRITTTLDTLNGIIRIALNPSEKVRKLVLVNPNSGVLNLGEFLPITFFDYDQANAEFLIIYTKALNAELNGKHWVTEYASFRQNSPYNPFDTLTVEIRQIYDQFGYGIPRHPMAIRNLIHFGIEHWENLEYTFIIGKGHEYDAVRNSENPGSYYIPTFGKPGADNLFSASIGSSYPTVPIGRLPATSPNDARVYLEKVTAYEAAPFLSGPTIPEKEWMKRILHLGGGLTPSEINQIKSNLAGMEQKIENNRFGGEVTTFIKTSSDPVQTSATEGIINRINEGVAFLTFFGHSSPAVLDFNFDDPDSYENAGKYPIFLAFGCNSGNMFNYTPGVGERFLKAEQKGIVGYISNTGFGYISSLYDFGQAFYDSLGGSLYGSSIGHILRSSNLAMDASFFFGNQALAQQMSIQGDPSLHIYFSEKPDYVPNSTTAHIEPRILNTLVDSFSISLNLQNIGAHLPDTTFVVQIRHQLPNGDFQELRKDTIQAPAFSTSYSTDLPLLGEDLVGLNQLQIKVDAFDQIEETNEMNNDLSIPFYVNSFEAIPLYPPNFGIVNQPAVTLSASTGNPFDPSGLFRMEIDTTKDFNSPIKQNTQIIQKGGILKWKPNIPWRPNTVYYWQVSPESLPGQNSLSWRSSSFVYLPESSPGWNQSHFFQYEDDAFWDMELPDSTRKLKFITDVVDLKIRNNVGNLGYPPRYLRGNQIELVDSSAKYTGQIPAGLFFAVFDTVSVNAISWNTIPAGATPSSTSKKALLFRTDTPARRAQVIDFLENKIPDGYYVLMFTCQKSSNEDYKPQEWDIVTINGGPTLFEVFEEQGATEIHNLATLGSRPYNLFYRKNRKFYGETLGDLQHMTELNVSIPGSWTEGSLTSSPIGPATKWESLEWKFSGFNPDQDDIKLSIWGIRPAAPDTLLYDNVLKGDYVFSLDKIDANRFPKIKLEYYAKDPIQKTPPNLEYWRVHYVGVPEAALDPASHFSLQSDTLLQGAPLTLEIATENLSDYDMDSLLVRYTIVNAQNEPTNIEKRLHPLPARDTLITHLTYDTRPSTGVHQLTIDINPDGDQPEQTHINNVGVLQFFVERDLRNPLLDVTFDGMHILDGDLVSATPQIQIQLKDENPYLALEDTSLFRLLLVHPDGAEERLRFTDERIRFFPAVIQNGKNNRARIEFNPSFSENGTYALYIEAKDATGNETGDINHLVSYPNTFGYDYKISFKVITESMISNVLNYPNPFSTSTRFLYTLTGSEPPAYFTIQILTVSGRVVREITQNEIGPMHIGTHLTDYAWDGRDQFGDPLANGVYLYRIVAKKANGENFKAYASGADAYFEKGYGKMVIIR